MPVILFILFAVISVGIYIYDLTVFTMASNKGLDARLGVMNQSMPDEEKDKIAKDAVKDFAGASIFVDNIDAYSFDSNESKTISVSIEGDFNFVLPFLDEIFGDILHMKSKSTFVYQG